MTQFTIGADPEIFLTKKKTPLSAHGLIPGTKKEPSPVPSGAIQVDGMAVEFNIEPTALMNTYSAETFNRNIVQVMKGLKEAVQKAEPEARFNIAPVQDFGQEIMDAQPEEARELGCDPDFNAYTLQQNPRPEGDAVTYRTASGHIHVGWGADIPVDHPDHMKICSDFIKMMDIYVGMYMTIIDTSTERRNLYGKAGAFRPKPYGVEYRTPSNVWIVSKARRNTIFWLTHAAVNSMRMGYSLDYLKGLRGTPIRSEEDIQNIINEGDYERAYAVLTFLRKAGRIGSHIMSSITTEYKKRVELEAEKKAA